MWSYIMLGEAFSVSVGMNYSMVSVDNHNNYHTMYVYQMTVM